MYIVIIGLSWWVKSQSMERDPEAWNAVHDVSWVIQQMMICPSGPALKAQKRALESKENEGRAKKR